MLRRELLSFGGLMLAAPHVSLAQIGAQTAKRTPLFLSGLGPVLTLFQLDVAGAKLIKKASLKFPVPVQYVWPHPTQPVIYVSSAELPSRVPGAAMPATGQFLSAVKVDVAAGKLTLHGSHVAVPARANHITVDHGGSYLLSSHPQPKSLLMVHRINADLLIGASVPQAADLPLGIYSHQVRVLPSNKAVIQVARGNNATATTPEDPGSLRVFRFDKGRLTPNGVVAPNGGYGFGPRHLDFHPTQPWVYVSLERQNAMHMYRLRDDNLEATPAFVRNLLEHPEHVAVGQIAGPIHVHPNGRTLYCANRGDSENHAESGENNVVVFDLNPRTGEPARIQTVDAHGFHPRTFSLDASGKVLVVGNLQSRQDAGRVTPCTAATFHAGNDGRLEFAQSYDLNAKPEETEFWSGVVTL
ncbi:MAG: beta-propeller fold lactonase family protein [Steroidobacteraceae bacterium]